MASDVRLRPEGAQIVIMVEDAEESHIGLEDIALDVIYDADLIVINKPVLVVYPAFGSLRGRWSMRLNIAVRISPGGRGKVPRIVHRIDKETPVFGGGETGRRASGWRRSLRPQRRALSGGLLRRARCQ